MIKVLTVSRLGRYYSLAGNLSTTPKDLLITSKTDNAQFKVFLIENIALEVFNFILILFYQAMVILCFK